MRLWTYDLAREQAPTLEHLRSLCALSLDAGYDAIGLYLEHRFAYPSAPWAGGGVTPAQIQQLRREAPALQIVPFVNLLGHFEGFIYTEEGKRFRENRLSGMQACPSNPEFGALCRAILDDTLAAFDSEIIHIGGDETWQLGSCPVCSQREGGKAAIYAEHFGPLARHVIERGRRPAVWGDMFLEHPSALDALPKETLIFDWQYFASPLETSRKFQERGFEVVCCPSIQTYNAVWCHLAESRENVRQAYAAAETLGSTGVCVTTWECGLFGSYETLLPAIRAAGSPSADLLGSYDGDWARLMGIELPKLGGPFAHSTTRSSLKVRLLLEANPFLAWLYHHEDLAGPVGDEALSLFEEAIRIAPNAAYRGVAEFGKAAVQFVRFADEARQAYANRLPGVAVASLAPCRQLFETLERVAQASHLNFGGSRADIARCRIAREHVERVMLRIKEYGDGSLGYLPAFEIISHPKFVPHDQGAWWLINRWANE